MEKNCKTCERKCKETDPTHTQCMWDEERMHWISADTVASQGEKVERFEKVAEWISVEDRLPERNQNVLIAREKPFHTYLLTAFQRDGVFHSNQDAIMLGKVTHWMPLPKPPVK